jgi:hypothetical protein
MTDEQIRNITAQISEVKKDLHKRMDNLESNVERYRMAAETRCQRQTEATNAALSGINRELGEISAGLGLKASRDDVTQTRISIMKHQQQDLRELVKADQLSRNQWIKIIGIIVVAVASAFGIQISM